MRVYTAERSGKPMRANVIAPGPPKDLILDMLPVTRNARCFKQETDGTVVVAGRASSVLARAVMCATGLSILGEQWVTASRDLCMFCYSWRRWV